MLKKLNRIVIFAIIAIAIALISIFVVNNNSGGTFGDVTVTGVKSGVTSLIFETWIDSGVHQTVTNSYTFTNMPVGIHTVYSAYSAIEKHLVMTVSSGQNSVTFNFDTPNTNTLAGVNYLSYGDQWAVSVSNLDADFSRFSNDGIQHISARIICKFMEPSVGTLSSSELSNFESVLTEAAKYGIKVNVDFWTQFGVTSTSSSTLAPPSWMSDYWNIVDNTAVRTNYINYMVAVVNMLKGYPAVESWTVMNEPYWGAGGSKTNFQTFFPLAYNALKSADPSHLVTCRFTLSYTPGSGKYDASVYSIFDVFSVTEYLDPSNPTDSRYNSVWSYWNKTLSDLKALGKHLWVIEFGYTTDWGSQTKIASVISQSLAKFDATGIVDRAYVWAWEHNSYTIGGFNIFDGINPRQSYNELKTWSAS